MALKAIRFVIISCVLASMQASPPVESLLFTNFKPGDKPMPRRGGWRIGTLDKEYAGAKAVGLLITPSSSGRLERIELVVHRESGRGNLAGYLMTDARGPGSVISEVSFSVPESSVPLEAQLVSANVSVLSAGLRNSGRLTNGDRTACDS